MRRWWVVCLLIAVLAGCAAYGVRMAPALRALSRGEPDRALELVDRDPDPGSVLWQMEKGLLLRLAGQFRASNEALAAALERQDELYTRSISNEAAALAVSDALRPYRAPDHELAFLHVYAALNYLDLGELDEAVVEARALSLQLQERTAPGTPEGEGDWGFGRLVAGLVLEAGQAWNDAWIAYRAAEAAYRAEGTPVTPELQELLDEAVSRAAVRAGIEEGEAGPVRSRLIVFVEEGFVPPIEDVHLRVPVLREEEDWGRDRLDPWSESVGRRAVQMHHHHVSFERQEVAYLIDVALPSYPERTPPELPPRVRITGRFVADAVPAVDVEGLARSDLDQRLPGIAARAAARAILKALASRAAARRSGDVMGNLTNLLGVVTERADTRSWSSLPERISLLALEVPPGAVELEVTPATGGRSISRGVTVPQGGTAFLDCRLFP